MSDCTKYHLNSLRRLKLENYDGFQETIHNTM
jgi:hypothetical protein